MNISTVSHSINGSEVAIIGLAGRFSKAKNLDDFWQNLRDGVESISFFTDEELLSSGIDAAVFNDPNYVRAKAVLEDAELFDASFFGFNPREAEITDPQHRIFLECAWEALENSGYKSGTGKSSIGVFAGSSLSSYLLNVYLNRKILCVDEQQIAIGCDKDFLSTRTSYKLNLTGPSYTVQTACSTSLVAVHLACQSLLNGECNVALAGGVSISASRKEGYFSKQGSILSPDGHCRAFDAKAQGSVGGEGVGIVVLKRLDDAITDRDSIHAVIKSSATNNDGSNKVSYTAPRIDSQAKVIKTAQAVAEIEPETITYIEAHGTGTSLGDPIEIAALTQAFQSSTQKKGFCAIGSLKTNIGHLDTAAGVAGLIKTVLALKHKQIPPSLHFEEPNPQIDFANSPLYVNNKLSEWKADKHPRRAGVSSFGFGGTNAHVILEEAPVFITEESPSRPWQLLMLSAKTDSALETATTNLVNHLQQHPEFNLADVAYTLQVGRCTFSHQRTVVCQDIQDAIIALQNPKRVLTSVQQTNKRSVAFMFTGLGTHYVNMGWELYQVEPIFQKAVDLCCSLLKPLLGINLKYLLYPNHNQTSESSQASNLASGSPQSGFDLRKMLGRDEEQVDEATEKLNQTWLTQPVIFIIEYALAQLWQSWGIRPVAMIGYSIGEYVAATLAEVLSLKDAITLVARRAQMIQELPAGAMLAVPLSEEKMSHLLGENLSLSAINGSSLCVVAGTTEAVDKLSQQLATEGLVCRRLQTSHAFHSHMMEQIAESFTDLVKTVSLQAPKIPYLSNVTGTWITTDQATDPSYWTKHLCQPVRFADGVCQLWKKHSPILLEVGPGQTLSSLALQCLECQGVIDKVALPSLRYSYDRQSDVMFLLNTLGQLWLSGVEIDWSGFYAAERRHRLPLPTYPFERQHYWIEPQKNTHDVNLNQAALEQKLDRKNWFYTPSWKQTAPPEPFEPGKLIAQKQCWLVFIDACGIGFQIIEGLETENQDVIIVRVGEQFARLSEREYIINPQNRDDYNALLKDLRALDKIPATITHLWNITAQDNIQSGLEDLEKAQALGFYSLLFLAQALGEQNITDSVQIDVVSNNLQELTDADELCPEKATILGPCKVIPQEYSNITCRSIDITLPQLGTKQWLQLIDQLLAEFAAKTSDQVIAYRGNRRWVQSFEALPVKGKTLYSVIFRQGGVYVITGGLGGLGLGFSRHLAKVAQAKLVLIGRSGLPPKAEWKQWLSSHDEQNLLSTKIKQVQALEELGAEVLIIKADVCNLEQMQAMVNQVCNRFGEIHGVIHAAGVASGNIIQMKTPEMAASTLEPKVKGTLVLDAVSKDLNLDFLVLFSSLSSIIGGLGQVDYCAASAFLDAFSHYNFYRRQKLTVSINWGIWQVNNLQDSFFSSAPEIQTEVKQMREKYGLTFQEGTDALSHILSMKLPQVVVSTQKLQNIIEHENRILSTGISLEKVENQIFKKKTRPILKTAYVAPSNDTECIIADIYQELLGIAQVGVHDNFFDLGGHSLIGIQLISQIHKKFEVELSIRYIFEAPTIAELALVVEAIIIREIGKLTEDEIEELV